MCIVLLCIRILLLGIEKFTTILAIYSYRFPKVDLTRCINFEIGPEILCALKYLCALGGYMHFKCMPARVEETLSCKV